MMKTKRENRIAETVLKIVLYSASLYALLLFYSSALCTKLNIFSVVGGILPGIVIFLAFCTEKARRILLPLTGAGYIFTLIIMKRELASGIRIIYNRYAEKLSENLNISMLYYRESQEGNAAFAKDLAFIIIFLVSVFILSAALSFNRPLLMLLSALPAFMLCLFIGKFPETFCFLLLFSAFISLLTLKHGSISIAAVNFSVCTAVSLVILLMIIPLIPEDKVMEKMESTRSYQTQLISDINEGTAMGNLVSLLSGSFAPDASPLENRSLSFTQDELLKVSINHKPNATIYLKNFSGGIYTGNSWEVCPEYSGAETNESIYRLLSGSELYSNQLVVIEKTGYVGQYLPIPYFSESTAELDFEEDYYCRNLFENPVTFTGFPDAQLNIDSAGVLHGITDEASEYDVSLFSSKAESAYDDYVMKNNSYVPDKLKPELDELISQYSTGDIYDTVVNVLSNTAVYSDNPPSIPASEDFCDYFLRVNHCGYCQHFASAAVMLLREMGVASRYTTGFLVPAESFTENNGIFTASVKDSMAHAWAEIYAAGYGWLPVEVTPAMEEETEEAEEIATEVAADSDTAESTEANGNKVEKAENSKQVLTELRKEKERQSPSLLFNSIPYLAAVVFTLAILKFRAWHIRKKRLNPQNRDILFKDLMGIYRAVLPDKNMADSELIKSNRAFLKLLSDGELRLLCEITDKYEFSEKELSAEEWLIVEKAYGSARAFLSQEFHSPRYVLLNLIKAY